MLITGVELRGMNLDKSSNLYACVCDYNMYKRTNLQKLILLHEITAHFTEGNTMTRDNKLLPNAMIISSSII